MSDQADKLTAWRDQLRAERAAARAAGPPPEEEEDPMPRKFKKRLDLTPMQVLDVESWVRRWVQHVADTAPGKVLEQIALQLRAGPDLDVDVSGLDLVDRDSLVMCVEIWCERAQGEGDSASAGLSVLANALLAFVWPSGRPDHYDDAMGRRADSIRGGQPARRRQMPPEAWSSSEIVRG